MKQHTPTVSVLMPVCNGQKYIKKAVNSILTQSFSDFEFIIINDGSTDATGAILDTYTDQRIVRITYSKNRGLVKALNDGLQIAKGKYIARMDADDISLPRRLEIQTNYMSINPNCIAVGSYTKYIDPEGWPIKIHKTKLLHHEIVCELMSGKGNAIVHGVAMIRKKGIEDIGNYKDKYEFSEDLDLFLRLSEIGNLANLPKVLLKNRRHTQSVTHKTYHKWKNLKTQIINDANKQKGFVFDESNIKIGSLYHDDFQLSLAKTAMFARNYHTAIKNYLTSICINGPQKTHLKFFKEIYNEYFKKIRDYIINNIVL